MTGSVRAMLRANRPPAAGTTLSVQDAPHAGSASGVIVVLAVALGALLRVPWVTEADFPLNDGGFVYAMVRDLQAASYALPDFTSYNAGDLPFAYPPLMLYAAAALDDLGPWSLLDVFLFVPALLGVASILAFAALARAVLGRGLAAAVATLAYALLPMSSMWLTMGGGLTWSAGALFSLLALYQATLLFQRGQRRYIATTAVLSALTVLSHPETALFTAYSAVLLFFAFGPSWGSFRNAVVVSIGVLVLASPWWLSVVARHGVEPFLVLGDDGSAWLSGPKELLLLSGVTHEDLFPFLAMLAVLGVLGSLRDRRYLLPVWLVLPYLLQGRSADQRAVVPIAMLVGVAVIEVLPALLPAAFSRARGRLSRTAQLAAGALVLYLVASTSVSLAGQLQPLDPEHREAMTWVSEHTPPSSIFLVASHGDWYRDRAAEWFPVLAGRESVATVQG